MEHTRHKHSHADFIKLEHERISFDKWIEGCKINTDPGDNWVFNWVKINAEMYRKEWEKSLCQCCKHCLDKNIEHHYKLDGNICHFCGLNMVYECDQFKQLEEDKNEGKRKES